MFYKVFKLYCECKGRLMWDKINDNYFCEECNKQYTLEEMEVDEAVSV